MKNALAGTALPRINAFVDAYNAVSLAHVLPAGADDLDSVGGDLAFRFSRDGDDFRDMGALDAEGRPLADPPKPGEVVYADARKCSAAAGTGGRTRAPRSCPATRRAVVTLQANGEGDPAAAAEDLIRLLRRRMRRPLRRDRAQRCRSGENPRRARPEPRASQSVRRLERRRPP